MGQHADDLIEAILDFEIEHMYGQCGNDGCQCAEEGVIVARRAQRDQRDRETALRMLKGMGKA